MKEKISVIIPTYNRKNIIMKAVNSVLQQSTEYFDYEIIVSDDGSTDNTEELFLKTINPKIKYYRNKVNKGVNAARNLGIKKSTGDYILLLDSDDSLSEDAFKIILRNMDKSSKINFFGTADEKTGRKLYHLEKTGNYSYKDWLEEKKIRGEFLPMSRIELFGKRLFDERRFCFESFFWNKAIKDNGVYCIDIPIRKYVFSEDSISKQLLNPKKAKIRFEDYKLYIKEFEEDYKNFGLKKKLSEIFFKTGFYGILSKNMKEGQKYLNRSIKFRRGIKNSLLLLVSFFGHGFVKSLYVILFVRK